MDEKIKISPEQQPSHEHGGEAHHSREQAAEKAKHSRHEHQEKLEHIRAKAEALSAEKVKNASKEDAAHQPKEAFVNKELKEMAYARTLSRVQRQLSNSGRRTSKIIHQPVVNAVSETVGKTVGRSSGLLGSGIVAFAGTTIYYYVTKHYGYEYSFTVFLVLLAGGLVVGWLAELVYKVFRPSK